jgi:hypothetical protein
MELLKSLEELKCLSLSLSKNEDSSINYMTAAQWIDDSPDDFDGVAPEDLAAMKASGVIWTLQVYPNNPIGFYRIHAPTPERAIERYLKEVPDVAVRVEAE